MTEKKSYGAMSKRASSNLLLGAKMSWLSQEELKKFKKVGRDVKISTDCKIIGHENIEIGDNVRIDMGTIVLAAKGFLKLGSHIHIACNNLFLCGGGITLEDHTTVSFGSKFISASDNFDGNWLIGPNIDPEMTDIKKAPIIMRRLSQVTTDCVLLPGVTMKDGAVLGAKSLAVPFQIFESFSTYFGVPAKFVRYRTQRCVAMSYEWEKKYYAIPQDEPQG